MGTEAQKLITVSLEKIANCRRRRREMSLHKNLLVTTVIHKARIAIMEETYYMMSYVNKTPASPEYTDDSPSPYYNRPPPAPLYGNPSAAPHYPQPPPVLAAAPSLADLSSPREPEAMEWESGGEHLASSEVTTDSVPCESGGEEDDDGDKENLTPVDYSPCGGEVPQATSVMRLACRPTDNQNTMESVRPLKRHRPQGVPIDDVDDETLLPSKKIKWDTASEMDSHRDDQDDTSHALRLVSVFSASLGGGPCPAVRLVRSMSTPDLCSQQAKDTMELMGSRPLAIAV